MDTNEAHVWQYLLGNRQATEEDIVVNCGVSEAFAQYMLGRISSPNWREPVEGKKFDTGKARYDLIPPEIEEAIAKILTFGADKYGERNWELGMAWGRPYAALRRHMAAWWSGEENDPESNMPHTWHAACCLAFIVAFEARGVGTDDRPTKAD
jgi:hypothetical protein